MFYVYVLKSLKDENLYIGFTGNLKKRSDDHNAGTNFSTKSRLPLELIYYESFLHEEEAREKEKFYKSGRGHEVLYKTLFVTLQAKK